MNKTKQILSLCYDLLFKVDPKVFFLGAAGGWGLDLGADKGFLGLGWRESRPRISQNMLHWCKALNWSMKEVEQFPLKPLYLQKQKNKKIIMNKKIHKNSRFDNPHISYSPFPTSCYSNISKLHSDSWKQEYYFNCIIFAINTQYLLVFIYKDSGSQTVVAYHQWYTSTL